MLICIIDDHLVFGQALKKLILSALVDTNIIVYNNPLDFLNAKQPESIPDLVISDILMPAMSGMNLMNRYKKEHSNTRFLFLSSVTNITKVMECINNGAAGYLSKDVSETELLKAVETILKGEYYLGDSLKEKWVYSIFPNKNEAQLSPRELQVLEQICNGATPKEIADNMKLALNTIQQYIKLIMRKTGVNRTTELVIYAIKKGLFKIDLEE